MISRIIDYNDCGAYDNCDGRIATVKVVRKKGKRENS